MAGGLLQCRLLLRSFRGWRCLDVSAVRAGHAEGRQLRATLKSVPLLQKRLTLRRAPLEYLGINSTPVSKGRQHHACGPPFETRRFAALLRVRWYRFTASDFVLGSNARPEVSAGWR